MGLLDGFLGDSFDDPRTTGNLALAQGLLSDPRAMRGLAGGLLARQEAIRTAKQQQLQDQMQALQVQQMKQKMALLAPILGQMAGGSGAEAPSMGAPAPQGVPSATPAQSAPQFNAQAYAAATPQQKQSYLMSMPLEHVAALKLAGVADLTNDWKLAREGFKRDPGAVYELPDGRTVSTPTVSQDGKASQVVADPSAPGGYRIITPAGALDAFTGYKNAEEGAKARLDLVDWTNPTDGQVYKVTREQLAQLASGGGKSSPSIFTQRGADMVNQEAQNGPVAFNLGGQRGVIPRGGQVSPASTGPGASPIGLGVASGQTPAQLAALAADKEAQTTAAKNAADYENNLNSKVVAGRELVRRVNEQEQLLNQFRTGATGPMRSKFALMAKDMGAPKELVEGIAGGDPAAAQEFTKFAAQTNLEQLKQAIGANRMLKTEFEAFQEANPSIASDPTAIRKVFGWLRDTYSRDYGEQQALSGYKKQGLPLADFPSWYSSQQHDQLMKQSTDATAPQAAQTKATMADVRHTAFIHKMKVADVLARLKSQGVEVTDAP